MSENEIQDIEVDALTEEDLESVSGGNTSVNATSCCSGVSNSCCCPGGGSEISQN